MDNIFVQFVILKKYLVIKYILASQIT